MKTSSDTYAFLCALNINILVTSGCMPTQTRGIPLLTEIFGRDIHGSEMHHAHASSPQLQRIHENSTHTTNLRLYCSVLCYLPYAKTRLACPPALRSPM